MTPEQACLQEIRARWEAAAVRIDSKDDGDSFVRCPFCDGQGELDSELFDTVGVADGEYVGVQAFGIGKERLAAVESLLRHLQDDMPWLIEQLGIRLEAK